MCRSAEGKPTWHALYAYHLRYFPAPLSMAALEHLHPQHLVSSAVREHRNARLTRALILGRSQRRDNSEILLG